MTTDGEVRDPVVVSLRRRRASLGPALARVADVVLADPGGTAARSIGEVAAAAGTSPSTVVRLCRLLGLAGYPELRLALAGEATRSAQLPRVSDIEPGDDLASVVKKIAAADIRAVQDTAEHLSIPDLARAIEALAQARRVDVLGIGASGVVALDLQQKLARIGMLAVGHTDAHSALTSVALAQPDDVIVAVSHSGVTLDTLDPVRLARSRGAQSIAVTQDPTSPLAREADHVLLTVASESRLRTGATASRLAQLTVVDCLFIGVAQSTLGPSQESLRATYDAVHSRRPT